MWFLPNVGPWLMGVRLREESEKSRAGIAGAEEPEPGVRSAFQSFAVRAYRVTSERLVNRTVGELEALPRERRVFISRIRHEGAIVEPAPDTVIHRGRRDRRDDACRRS